MERKLIKQGDCRLEEVFQAQGSPLHTMEISSRGDIFRLDFEAKEIEAAARTLALVSADIENAKDSKKHPNAMFPLMKFQTEDPALMDDATCLRFEIASGVSFRFLIPLKLVPQLQEELTLAIQRASKRQNATKQ